MNSQKGIHLGEEQLIRAAVDEEDMPPSLREHLSTCSFCRAEKKRFEGHLARLGRMAQHFAPSAPRRVSLPLERSRSLRGWSWGWRRVFVAAMSVAVVIMVFAWPTLLKKTPKDNGFILPREMYEDEAFILEVRTLEEDALPQVYLDISGASYGWLDEEFIEFVVPTVQRDELSIHERKRGTDLC